MTAPTLTGFEPTIAFDDDIAPAQPQVLDADVAFDDAEGDFNGGTLTLSGLLAEDRAAVRDQGTNAGQIGVSGTTVTYGGVAIGVLSGGSGSTLTVTFNAAATSAAVDALIQNLTYVSVSDTPSASRTLLLNVADASGADLGPAAVLASFAPLSGADNPFNSIDVGSSSTPSFVDLDGDGDLDAAVGATDGQLQAYRNGSATASGAFTPLTGAANPFSGIVADVDSAPTFVDLDNDGDADAVVGASDGTLRAYRNGSAIAPGAFTQLTGSDNPFAGIDIGILSKPSFVDLDRDGDMDAVVGTSSGTVRAYRNGSVTAPGAFTQLTVSENPFAGIDVGNWATPSFVDLDGDGDLDAVVGEMNGTLLAYRNGSATASGAFTLLTGEARPFNGVDVGNESAPSFLDLDGDGDLDAVVGAFDGTLRTFANLTPRGWAVTVTVAAQNDAPTLTGDRTATVAEGGRYILSAADLGFTDPDDTEAFVTFTAGGATGGVIQVNGVAKASFTGAQLNAGEVSFLHDGSEASTAGFQVAVEDGNEDASAPLAQAFAFTVTPVNDAPVVNADTATVAEDGSVLINVLANDTDAEGQAVSFVAGSVSATNGTAVIENGQVRFTPTANYNGPATVSYMVTDGSAPTSGTAGVTVTAVNDVPTLSGFAPTFVFNENTLNATAQLLDADATFDDVDFAGGTLELLGLLAEDRAAVRNDGFGAGQIGTSGTTVSYGGVNIGTVTGGSGTTLTVTFNEAATSTAVDALIQNLTYANVSDTPTADRTLLLNVTDASGAALSSMPSASSFSPRTGADNPFNGIYLGYDSAPSFADLDGDGDQDVIIGSYSGELRVYRNGSATASGPFEPLIDAASPLNGIDVGSYSMPSFVDLDRDGDLDAVVGESHGTLRAYRNGSESAPGAFTALTGADDPFDGINVSGFSAPSFVDLDGDGDLDGVVGQLDGTMRAYRNGSATAFGAFTALTGAANPFSGIDGGSFSTPTFVDLDGDGDQDAVVGASDGKVRAYRNGSATASGSFVPMIDESNPFSGIDVDNNSAPSFVDFDGDGDLDAVIGSSDGRLWTFANTTPPGQAVVIKVVAENEQIAGDAASNRLTGTAGGDTYSGGAGADVLVATAGDDILDGGAGVDTLDFSAVSGPVTVDLGLTTAQTVAAGAVMTLSGIENLTGTAAADTLIGDALANVIDGGLGADTMLGGLGNDVYHVRDAGDVVDEGGGSGADTVRAYVNHVLSAGVEDLIMVGALRGEGNALNNKITGGLRDETLLGMGGDDNLTGGGGRDVLTGGSGRDIFTFAAVGDSALATARTDHVTDFSKADGDRISVSLIDAVAGTPANDAFRFIGQAGFTGAAGELRSFYFAPLQVQVVQGDVDGDGKADFAIFLDSGSAIALTAGDFFL